MNIDEKVSYIEEIINYLGTPFKKCSLRNADWPIPDCSDGNVVISFNFDDWKKKLNIHARPGDGSQPDIVKRHEILYNNIPSSERDKWIVSIGVSLKDAHYVAQHICRRLLPDAWEMARAVEAKRIEIENATNHLAARIARIKEGSGETFREHHRNDDNKAYRWEAWVNDPDYREKFKVLVSNDECSLTINHLTPDQVVAFMRKLRANEV